MISGTGSAGSAASARALVFRSRRVLLPDGERAATVHVRDGRIRQVGAWDEIGAGEALVDAGGAALLPGLVDTHVHVNEPGRTEWEGFDTATRAAAAGGVTTLIDMPLNSRPPVIDVAALAVKREAASGRVRVDVGFWAGAVPGNEGARPPLHRAGAFGFKIFLCDSGVREFPPLDEPGLLRAFEQAAELGARLLVHAEWPATLDAARPAPAGAAPADDPRRYGTWLAARPSAAEDEAVAQVIALVRRTGASAHIVHVSSSSVLPALAAARAEGLPVSAETCPHYLTLAAEEIADGATLCKCAPPIRSAADRDGLWAALADGTLGAVVSDHSPSAPEGKRLESGDFTTAWGGISSLGLGLPLVWTEARRRGFALADVVRWMCAGPARIAGLEATKGAIAPGCDADLVAFDAEAWEVVGPADLHFRHPITPYAGRTLLGAVRATWLRGEPVYRDARFTDPPLGRLLERP
jgi:allantoinase